MNHLEYNVEQEPYTHIEHMMIEYALMDLHNNPRAHLRLKELELAVKEVMKEYDDKVESGSVF